MKACSRKLNTFLQTASLNETTVRFLRNSITSENSVDTSQTIDLELLQSIASASDRVNLETINSVELLSIAKHPISGQHQELTSKQISLSQEDLQTLPSDLNEEKLFWWLWRFYPEVCNKVNSQALVTPQHGVLPDCPQHSYTSTVSALTGAMYPESWKGNEPEQPYLLLFTFSPVQEFIKASRKFLDFWSGSYLLHYLSARLCWYVAQEYGPDAVVTPSLWGQEIIDALLLQKYSDFSESFRHFAEDGCDPKTRYKNKKSTSLTTAGFPNTITILVGNKEEAQELGKKLTEQLVEEWSAIALKVKENIKEKTRVYLENTDTCEELLKDFSSSQEELESNREELRKLRQPECWAWSKLWEAQINNSWEPYWCAVPLGSPEEEFSIAEDEQRKFDQKWIDAQEKVAQTRPDIRPPSEAEKNIYTSLNVGTWWGSVQARLGQAIQAVKNTRNWQIPAAPGERSTISGRFSAVHPFLLYRDKYKEGGGLGSTSMRLFWRVMAEVYPGLFNGSEKLNAIELTKRMAWFYGGVAETLGMGEVEEKEEVSEEVNQELEIGVAQDLENLDYEQMVRFPNLSSIAAARFTHNDWEQGTKKMIAYWRILAKEITANLREKRDIFGSRTRGREFHVPKTDAAITKKEPGNKYNGVMFSSKWLADDMGLEISDHNNLRGLVDEAHKKAGFGNSSPGDWWVILLGDGDGMGQYVNGRKLKEYQEYLANLQPETYQSVKLNSEEETEFKEQFQKLLETRKRMGPATHIGLNRALLDFSNRLVPYLTEKRFCGKVIYSGGDDVMAVLPLEDLPEYLRSLKSAWCGGTDPGEEFANQATEDNPSGSGYWCSRGEVEGVPKRPLFTMGKDATMSVGVVVAHKSVPLPTVLEALWDAEKERAKKLLGTPNKDGLCFRVIYSSGNVLEALMKGHLLDSWWDFVNTQQKAELTPLLYRLAEELPQHAVITKNLELVKKAAQVIINKREESKQVEGIEQLPNWLNEWEKWAYQAAEQHRLAGDKGKALGTQLTDLKNLLRFTAFWLDKMAEREKWLADD
ncbi:MAG: type III-B CRISPR-associated protein Cas10/Cmr2 [Spirulinaceae cyanobacterium]